MKFRPAWLLGVAWSCTAGSGGLVAPSTAPATPASAPPASAPPPFTARSGDIAITDVTVVPMTGDTVLVHHTVVIRGDRIAAVAPNAQVVVPAGATVIAGSGRWLMPGLADMHVHVWREDDLVMYLAAGVTTIRNMWGVEQHLRWRSQIARGELLGPTIVTAGSLIDGDPPDWAGSVVLRRAEDADALVAAQKAAGYDFLKPVSQLSREAYEALAAAGERHGMVLAGHVPVAVGLDGVLAAKQHSIEHLDHWLAALVPPGVALPPDDGSVARDRAVLAALKPSRMPALIRRTIAAGSWNCPTLITLDRLFRLDDVAELKKRVPWLDLVPAAVRARWTPELQLPGITAEDFKTIRDVSVHNATIAVALAASGAPLVLGTDTGIAFVVPGESLHGEIELFAAFGVPRHKVLRMATADAWRYLGQPHEAGVIEAGARADLLLVATDPLSMPLPLVPDGVMVRGRWLPRADLEARLAEVATRAAQPIDLWGSAPLLAADGKELSRAEFRKAIADTIVGQERLVVSAVGGKRIIAGQIAEPGMDVEASYRFGPDAAELSSTYHTMRLQLTVKLAAGRLMVTGTDLSGAPVSLSAPVTAAAFLSAPSMGGAIQLAERLTGMKPGSKREIAAVEISYFPAIGITPIRYQIGRKPDRDGRRVFAVTAVQRGSRTSSELAVDDGGVAQLTAGPEITARAPPASR